MQKYRMRAQRDGVALRTKAETVLIVDRVNEEVFVEVAARFKCGNRQQAARGDGNERAAVSVQATYSLHSRLGIFIAGNEQHDVALGLEIVEVDQHPVDETLGHGAVLIEE